MSRPRASAYVLAALAALAMGPQAASAGWPPDPPPPPPPPPPRDRGREEEPDVFSIPSRRSDRARTPEQAAERIAAAEAKRMRKKARRTR